MELSITYQRVLFWAAFWAIVAIILHLVYVAFALTFSLAFGTVPLTATIIGEIFLEGLSQIFIYAIMGALGGVIWIGMRGERFGNLSSFIYWAVYWTFTEVIVTIVMLIIYGLFGFNISLAILPGIIGMFGSSREKQFFRQHLFPEKLEGKTRGFSIQTMTQITDEVEIESKEQSPQQTQLIIFLILVNLPLMFGVCLFLMNSSYMGRMIFSCANRGLESGELCSQPIGWLMLITVIVLLVMANLLLLGVNKFFPDKSGMLLATGLGCLCLLSFPVTLIVFFGPALLVIMEVKLG